MPNLIHVPSHPGFKLGKQEPTTPRLLHFNDIKMMGSLDTSSPQPFDYTVGMPSAIGMMFNDTYGDCTAAAKYHRLQIIVFRLTGKFLTGESLQNLALELYSKTTGFDPTKTLSDGTNPTDQGGNMQTIAEELVSSGMPLLDGTVDRFVAAFMIDPQNVQDLAYCGRECLGIDFGITCTTNVMPENGAPPPPVWDVGGQPLGGHDVYGPGRLVGGNWKVGSWGKWYEWTPAFGAANVTEAICYVSADALADGKTVLGLDMQTWLNAMAGRGAKA